MSSSSNGVSLGNTPAVASQSFPLNVKTKTHPITEIVNDRFPTTAPNSPPLKVTLQSIFEKVMSVVGTLQSKSLSDVKKDVQKKGLELVKIKPEAIKAGDVVVVERDQGTYCEVFEATSKGTSIEYAEARPNSPLRKKTDNTVKLRTGPMVGGEIRQSRLEHVDTKTGTEYWLVRNRKIVPSGLSTFQRIASIIHRFFRF